MNDRQRYYRTRDRKVFEYVLDKDVAPSARIVDISGLGTRFYEEVDQIDIIATPALAGETYTIPSFQLPNPLVNATLFVRVRFANNILPITFTPPASLQMYFSTQQVGAVMANLVPGILYMLEITSTNIRTIRIEPVNINGSVPPPLNPGDNNKVLTASGGTFSWQSIPSQLPTINDPADNGKVLTAQNGASLWTAPTANSRFFVCPLHAPSQPGPVGISPPIHSRGINNTELNNVRGNSNTVFRVYQISNWSFVRATVQMNFSRPNTTYLAINIVANGTVVARFNSPNFSSFSFTISEQICTHWLPYSQFSNPTDHLWINVDNLQADPHLGVEATSWAQIEFV
jgi:hypothetical protein